MGLFINDRVSLASFLNEEIARLRTGLQEGINCKEIDEDSIMVENTKSVITILDNMKNHQLNEQMVLDVLKIQKLVSEIKTDDD